MLNPECKQCHKKWHQDSASYCSWCGNKLVEEIEFKKGNIVASTVFGYGNFIFVRLNEDLTKYLNSVDGFWYIERDCRVRDASFEIFKQDTRHATQKEIAEYESALTFNKHGRKPFEVKKGDLLGDDEDNIFFVDFPNNWKKESFTSGRYTFLKTVEEYNEWLGADDK